MRRGFVIIYLINNDNDMNEKEEKEEKYSSLYEMKNWAWYSLPGKKCQSWRGEKRWKNMVKRRFNCN